MHPGYHAWDQEKGKADRQFQQSLRECASKMLLADLSLTFWFENMADLHYFHLRTPEDIGLIEDTGFTLDTGHANLNHCLPEFLKTGFSHMHIHDNDGRKDTHSAVGEGNIDFSPVIAALREKKATAVLEVKDFSGENRSKGSAGTPVTGEGTARVSERCMPVRRSIYCLFL